MTEFTKFWFAQSLILAMHREQVLERFLPYSELHERYMSSYTVFTRKMVTITKVAVSYCQNEFVTGNYSN